MLKDRRRSFWWISSQTQKVQDVMAKHHNYLGQRVQTHHTQTWHGLTSWFLLLHLGPGAFLFFVVGGVFLSGRLLKQEPATCERQKVADGLCVYNATKFEATPRAMPYNVLCCTHATRMQPTSLYRCFKKRWAICKVHCDGIHDCTSYEPAENSQ